MAKSQQQFETVRLGVPVSDADIADLKIGTVVYLDGIIYTAREGAYKRILEDGFALPDGIREASNVNFHCSPAATETDDGSFRVGGVTATASFRFSKWLKRWFEISRARVIIGKGGMSTADYESIFVPAKAIYLTTVGYGTGALLGRGIKGVREVHWLEELGNAQALWVFEVENIGPFLVECDLQGNSLFEQQSGAINSRIDELYADLKHPALRRFGEITDREDELI